MATPPATPPPAEHLTVLDPWSYYSDAPNAFYRIFTDEAFAPLAARKAAVEKLSTRADWERYRAEARRKMAELVGPFPEKTPLNARVTSVVQKGAYRIENVIYESQPGFHVTAALFVPESLQGRAPAILYCSGHSDAGYRSPPYLAMCLNLVKKGFVVLAFDPIGQGERLQYFNPRTGLSEFGSGSSTREHSRVGSQCFLTGDSLARYMIWDGIRSVDYLLTRPEVDPARLGITGRSGGGTQSAYIAACDDRILAAAPENYITTFESVLKMRGPQDAEQNFYRGVARGFDQADLLIARAPKPTLIVATTRDIFNIDGTQAAFAETRRAHLALGGADAIAMTVDDAEHTSTRKNREATYAFFRKHLNFPGDTTDENIERPTAAELRVTETGQVSTALQSETVFTLNRRRAESLAQKLDARRRNLPAHLASVKADAARLAGHTALAQTPQSVVFTGRFRREGYAIEKYLLPVDARYAIPVLALVPDAAPTKTVVYLHPKGKSAQAGIGGDMEALVKQGCAVVAPDMIGMTGEIGPGVVAKPEEGPPRLWYGYVLLGKSTIGRQVADLVRVARFAQSRFQVDAANLAGFARGEYGPLLLHAAALEGLFGKIALIETPLSYRSLVTVPNYAPHYLTQAVPGALTAYDLPDLLACVAPRGVLLFDPRDGRGAPVDAATLAHETSWITSAFAQHPARLTIVAPSAGEPAGLSASVSDWLR